MRNAATIVDPNNNSVRARIDCVSICTWMSIGVPLQSIGQRLLPLEDVSAFRLAGRRVVERDLARDVHAERDELAAIPSDVAHGLSGRRTDGLRELEHVAVAIEPVRGPRERRQPLERAHVGDVEAHVHEAAASLIIASPRKSPLNRIYAPHRLRGRKRTEPERCPMCGGKASGQLKGWQPFAERSSVVAQYAAYEPLPGLHINGELTQGENIADIGGVKLAYMALQKALAKKGGTPAKIDGFTPEQRFFLGFAQIWRNNQREEDLKLRLNTDPHSPGRFRTIGPLSNLVEFQKAFEIPDGSPMVRPADQRVNIW